ncbi:MAG: phage major capsid protein [Oscillospiraceae bacterium]|jgi:HK97 family phage major capsid protein|nr:phage major capsid protein [Oscillospiraceae bacterium]
MANLMELRERRSKAWNEAKAFLESKRSDSGIVSPDDTAVYEQMEAGVLDLTREIERLEQQEVLDAKFRAPTSAPVTNAPAAPGAPTAGRASNGYSTAFWNVMRNPRVVTNDLAEGTDPSGGYLVPDQFEHQLVQALEEHNIMRQLARTIRTASGEMKIPVVASRGSAAWVEEAAEIPNSDGSFGQVLLSAYKIGTIVKVSRELMADSAFPLESFLAQDFGRRIGTLEEEAFLVGDGTGKPTGVLTQAQVGKTAASATALTFDDVMDLYHSLKSPYRNKAVFITNDLTVKLLRKLKDTTGQYLWQPSVSAGTPDTILGRPVYVSGFVPQIAAGAKAMAFGDFSYYWIGDRQGRTFERINELYTETDQVGFKATQRVDGKLILPEAVQVLAMAAS